MTKKKAGSEVTGKVICGGEWSGRRERGRLIDREEQDVRGEAVFSQSLS